MFAYLGGSVRGVLIVGVRPSDDGGCEDGPVTAPQVPPCSPTVYSQPAVWQAVFGTDSPLRHDEEDRDFESLWLGLCSTVVPHGLVTVRSLHGVANAERDAHAG